MRVKGRDALLGFERMDTEFALKFAEEWQASTRGVLLDEHSFGRTYRQPWRVARPGDRTRLWPLPSECCAISGRIRAIDCCDDSTA